MGLGHSPSIVVDGLVFMIDPNNPNCYPGFGNTLYNIVNTSIGGTFVGYTSNPIDNTETRSIFFDGTNDYIDFGSSSSLKLTDNFTLSAWVKSNVYGDRAILGNFGPSSNYSGFNFNVQPNAKFAFLTGSHPNGTYLYADNTYNLNTWYHITGVRRNGTNYLYINGIAQTSTNTQVVSTSAQNFYFGKWYSNLTDYYHSGQIGQASLYNRALSATEILQNYNATKKKYMPDENIVTSGLVLKLDAGNINSYAGVGTVWNDLSGFGNTFYLINGPSFNSAKGGYISFDGSNDYARLHSLSTNLQSTTSFTVEMLFKFNNGNTSWKKLFGFLDSDDALEMWVEQAKFKDDTGLVSNKSFEYIDFTYMTYVVNSSERRLYFNGVLDKSGGGYSITLPTSYLGIASDIGRGYYCNMDVNLIQIYNRALTQQEISQNYNATKKRFVNALPPVRNGLVMELDAGQRSSYPGTGNTWYDLSGNSLNGTLTNGPTFSGLGATSSIVFDRSNDYVLVGDSSLLSNFTGMTVEVIVKYTTTNDQIFVQKWNYALGNDGYTLELFSSAIVGACYSAGSSYLAVSISNYPANNIYHIVFTLNGSTQTMYINGVLVATNSSGSVPITAGKNLMIGQRSSAGTYFGGNNFLTKFYNRGLSAYEVKQNFDFYRTRYNI